MPELITQSTLCYIHPGTTEKSPNNTKSMWIIKAQSEHNLREGGIVLDYNVDSCEWINNLPDIKHARLWNSLHKGTGDHGIQRHKKIKHHN